MSDGSQNSYLQMISQAINSLLETSTDKSNNKILQESDSGNFYSYEDCQKKLSYYPKIFTIISETNSEQNIRYSSFLLTQAKTTT
jgi:predicted nucleic acid-binding OB-fold protein